MTTLDDQSENPRDAAWEKLAAEIDRRLAAAGDSLEAAAPSAAVWDRIAARVDHLESERPTLTVRSQDGVWEPVGDGVFRKLLHVDADGGWQSFMLRLEPGATVAEHGHTMLEECVVLEGAFDIAGETVRQGDVHLAFAGHDHRTLHSPEGALLYIRAALGE